jgi:hypothetical protein
MATPVLAFAQIANECESEGLAPKNAERIAAEIGKVFSVHGDEVAILKLERSQLHFVYPTKLHNVGSIPLNTSTSVAARTANTKRAEAINNFAQIKHASVFESVELAAPKQHAIGGAKEDKQAHIIQKLMSVPVIGPAGVLGVIQVCRKGKSAPEAGTDFAPADLQKLVQIGNTLVKCFK